MRVIQWWRSQFLWAELGLAVLLTAAFATWVEYYGGLQIASKVLSGQRGSLYGTLASILGSLLGFVITTVSIVITFTGHDRLEVVRTSRHYPTLWKVFMSGIRALGFATLVTLIALLFDRDSSPRRELVYGVLFLTVLSALRLARCVWALENVIRLVTAGNKRN